MKFSRSEIEQKVNILEGGHRVGFFVVGLVCFFFAEAGCLELMFHSTQASLTGPYPPGQRQQLQPLDGAV